MQVTVNVPDQLCAQARARGVAVETYLEEALVRQAQEPEAEAHSKSVGEAIDRIMELRKGNTLGGLKVKELIHEGRKYG
jgi:post-segregation antitoxin (ccd killing protein)